MMVCSQINNFYPDSDLLWFYTEAVGKVFFILKDYSVTVSPAFDILLGLLDHQIWMWSFKTLKTS